MEQVMDGLAWLASSSYRPVYLTRVHRKKLHFASNKLPEKKSLLRFSGAWRGRLGTIRGVDWFHDVHTPRWWPLLG